MIGTRESVQLPTLFILAGDLAASFAACSLQRSMGSPHMAAMPAGNHERLSRRADQCRDKATGLYSLLEFALLLCETASCTTGDCCTFQGVSGTTSL